MPRLDPVSNSMARKSPPTPDPAPRSRIPGASSLPDELRGKLRKRLLWLFPVLALTALGLVGWNLLRAHRLGARLENLAAIEDHATAHRELLAFFEDHPAAVAEGLLDWPGEPAKRRVHLAFVARCLRDDYIFELPVQRRPGLRDTSGPRTFSLHDWIAGEDSLAWRLGLLDLAADPDPATRERAREILAQIALKVPEILAATPLEPFERDALRDLLLELSPATARPRAAASLGPFLLEALLREGRLRWWQDEKEEVLPRTSLVLSILERLHLPAWRQEALAEVLIGLDARSAPEDRRKILDRLEEVASPAALVHAIRLVSRRDEPPALRERALELVTRVGAPLLAPRLRLLLERSGDGLDPSRIEAALASLDARERELARPAEAAGPVDAGTLVYLSRRGRGLDYASPPGSRVLAHLGQSDLPEAGREAAFEVLERCPPVGGHEALVETLRRLNRSENFALSHGAARILARLARELPGSRASWQAPGEVWPLATAVSLPGSPPVEHPQTLPTGVAGQESACLELLESEAAPDQIRGATGLAWRSGAEALDRRWYSEKRRELLERYEDLTLEARLPLISLFARHELGGSFGEWAWKTARQAALDRREVEAWSLLQALEGRLELEARLAGQGASDGEDRPMLREGIRQILARAEGGRELTFIFAYLRARYPSELLDRTVQGVLETSREPGRVQLVRFFPIHPDPERVRLLVTLLGDSSRVCRFWALERLRALANGTTRGFDPAAPPRSPANLEARHRWLAWAESLDSGS